MLTFKYPKEVIFMSADSQVRPVVGPNNTIMNLIARFSNYTTEVYDQEYPVVASHAKERSFNKTLGITTFVLGLLTTFIWAQGRTYFGALGLLLTVASGYKSYTFAPNPAYTRQHLLIKNQFMSMAHEIRRNWEVASGAIAKTVSEDTTLTSSELANKKVGDLLAAYTEAQSWWLTTDPFQAFVVETDKPWRQSFKDLKPFVAKIAKFDTKDVKNPFVVKYLNVVIEEAKRMLNGHGTGAKEMPYVDCVVNDNEVTATPWPAPKLEDLPKLELKKN